jgi:hypothetical protein
MNKIELELSSLPAGTYLISVISAKEEKRFLRFVKQ